MHILEHDLRRHNGPVTDLHNIIEGRAVVLHLAREVLRVLRWCRLKMPNGQETQPGFVVVEFLRSRDAMWDDDIHFRGVRYATRSGVVIRAYVPDPGPLQRAVAIEDLYREFLFVPRNQDRPEVKKLVRNRVEKYLRDDPNKN